MRKISGPGRVVPVGRPDGFLERLADRYDAQGLPRVRGESQGLPHRREAAQGFPPDAGGVEGTMPTYQYRCTSCGTEIERVQKFSDPALTTCEDCGGSLRKVYNAVGVVFKGSGFYATDNRTKGSAAAASTGSEGSSGSGSSGSKASGDQAASAASTQKANPTPASKPAASD